MRFCFAIACLFLTGLFPVQAQINAQPKTAKPQTSQEKVAPAGPAKIDPAKEADIRHLLDLAGVKAAMQQTMDRMGDSLRPLLANSLPPGDYREKLIDLFLAKFKVKADLQHMLDLAVPLYDKYFSHEEIKGLIRFYETPLGQKSATLLPQISGEMGEEGRKWGGDLGREAMGEVLAEHPELAEAMEAAKKTTQP